MAKVMNSNDMMEIAAEVIDALIAAHRESMAEVARLQDELTSLRSNLQSMERQCKYFCVPDLGGEG